IQLIFYSNNYQYRISLMAERSDDILKTPSGSVDIQYAHSSVNYQRRWEVYKLGEPRVDFHETAAREAEFSGQERVLDVWCGDGSFALDYLYGGRWNEHGRRFEGEVLGIDKHRNLIWGARERARLIGADNIGFKRLAAEKLAFDHEIEDESFDAAFVLFSGYYFQGSWLEALQRKLRPDAKLIVATIGPDNKPWHRAFEAQMATWMSEVVRNKAWLNEIMNGGVRPDVLERILARFEEGFGSADRSEWQIHRPVVNTSRFNTVVAEDKLGRMFDIVKRYPSQWQLQQMVVTPDTADTYYDSLRSKQTDFYP